jgi:hypothetical protein
MTFQRYWSLLLLLPFLSCSVLKEDDHAQRTYHPNGKLHKEINKDKSGTGTYKEYFDNGQLFQEVTFVNNLREGMVKQYYNTGILYQETPYKKGRSHGIQKRYRRSGALMSEVPYHEGNICKGLKEYTVDGKVKERYPTIVVNTINNVRNDGTFIVELSLSDSTKNDVEYFKGKLTEGKYLSEGLQRFGNVKEGVGKLVYKIKKGSVIDHEEYFVARVRTYQGNYYLAETTVPLSIRF